MNYYNVKFKYGLQNMLIHKYLFLYPILYWIIIIKLENYIQDEMRKSISFFSNKIFIYLLYIFFIEMILFGTYLLIAMIGIVPKEKKYVKIFSEIGLTDQDGIPPVIEKIEKNRNGYLLYLFSNSITKSNYEEKVEELSTNFNMKVVDIDYGIDLQHVIIKFFKPNNNYEILEWKAEYLNEKESVFVLGESFDGEETFDISQMPHILIGGGTGSGKSTFVKLILYQAIEKNYSVFIADFKGGIDYSKWWHDKVNFITKITDLDLMLTEVISQMDKRKLEFLKIGASNINELNEKTKELQLKRIIVAIDEIAEVLDKAGLNKEQKQVVLSIESKLSTIARLGRAFGIHLIISTQRPDANLLSGQIKNNLVFRICGQADKVLSQIILDSSEASVKISPKDKGMFLTNTKVLFKAYYLKDNNLS